jgi:hypothetical protein
MVIVLGIEGRKQDAGVQDSVVTARPGCLYLLGTPPP